MCLVTVTWQFGPLFVLVTERQPSSLTAFLEKGTKPINTDLYNIHQTVSDHIPSSAAVMCHVYVMLSCPDWAGTRELTQWLTDQDQSFKEVGHGTRIKHYKYSLRLKTNSGRTFVLWLDKNSKPVLSSYYWSRQVFHEVLLKCLHLFCFANGVTVSCKTNFTSLIHQ